MVASSTKLRSHTMHNQKELLKLVAASLRTSALMTVMRHTSRAKLVAVDTARVPGHHSLGSDRFGVIFGCFWSQTA